MLSFFTKKKPSPDTPPDNVIQGPDSTKPDTSDDFVFLGQNSSVAGPSQSSSNITPYPPMPAMPPGFLGGIFPLPPTTSYTPYPPQVTADPLLNCSVPYIEGVPFELSPQLTARRKLETIEKEVKNIIAFIEKDIEHDLEYDFILERSILQQCY